MRLAVLSLCFCFVVKASGPELLARNVVGAANYASGSVTPGEIVVLYPSNAGPPELAESHLDGNGKMATMAGATRVLFDGIPAPVFYAVSGRVGAIVPYEVSGKTATEVVVEYQGVRSPPVLLPVAGSSPALFTLDSSGKGQAAMLNQTGCCNSSRNPAMRGAVAVLYATGAGQTTPPGISGYYSAYPQLADFPVPQLPVKATVGGIPAEIVYAGEAPLAVTGLFQVNFRVPTSVPAGDAVPLVLTVGDSRSPDGVTMAIRSEAQRVLLIDRDPKIRDSLTKILEGAGYAVVRTEEDGPIDLIICDAATPLFPIERSHVRIIAMSDSLSPETLRSADLLGAQAFLTKPLLAEKVLRHVRDLLASRAAP